MSASVPLETAYAAKDVDGKTVKDDLQRIGYIGDEVPGQHPVGANFEAHSEQRPETISSARAWSALGSACAGRLKAAAARPTRRNVELM
jgi:hypothetical protein